MGARTLHQNGLLQPSGRCNSLCSLSGNRASKKICSVTGLEISKNKDVSDYSAILSDLRYDIAII